jgi:hypothetical protein
MTVFGAGLRTVLGAWGVFGSLLWAASAYPADTPADAEGRHDTSVATTQASTPSRLSFSYYGVYQGPALSHPVNGGSIDSSTAEYADGEQNLANQFKLDISLSDNVFIGPVLNFQLDPFMGQGFYPLDSGVRIGHRQILHSDELNLMADFRVMAPLKPSYTKNDEVIDLQSLQVFTYKVPKTKLTLGVLGFHQFQAYGSGIPTRNPLDSRDPKDFNLYFAPNMSYQFTPALAAVLYYEMYPWHKVGAKWNDWSNDPSDIAPGISWDITADVNFTPQLLIYPGNLRWSTLGTVAYLSAKFL